MAFGGSTDPNSMKQIGDEIQRFESVHPHIYRAYNLIGSIENQKLRDQLEHEIVLIEGLLKLIDSQFTHFRCFYPLPGMDSN
jgi:hypothetical protein